MYSEEFVAEEAGDRRIAYLADYLMDHMLIHRNPNPESESRIRDIHDK